MCVEEKKKIETERQKTYKKDEDKERKEGGRGGGVEEGKEA